MPHTPESLQAPDKEKGNPQRSHRITVATVVLALVLLFAGLRAMLATHHF